MPFIVPCVVEFLVKKAQSARVTTVCVVAIETPEKTAITIDSLVYYPGGKTKGIYVDYPAATTELPVAVIIVVSYFV